MYALHTLVTAAIAYLVFVVVSLRGRKWYYPVIHPFAIICIAFIYYFRHASPVLAIAPFADLAIAIGVVVVSICFWTGYKLFCIIKCDESAWEARNRPSFGVVHFWVASAMILLAIIGYFYTKYSIHGSLNDVFFEMYKTRYADNIQKVITGEKIYPPLIFSLLHYICRHMLKILPFISLALLFETLKKNGTIKGWLPVTTAVLLTLASMVFYFGIGSRSLIIYFLLAIFVLIFFSLRCPQRSLSFVAIPILGLHVIVSLFSLVFIGSLRGQNLDQLLSSKNIKQISVIQNAKTILYLNKNNESTIEENLNSHQRENIVANAELASIGGDSMLKYICPLSFQASGLKKNGDDHYQSQSPLTKEEIEQKMKMELVLLKSLPVSYSLSKETAWIMTYFGRHENFLGIFYPWKFFLAHFIPGKWMPRGKYVGHIASDVRRHSGVSAVGPFGEGYASYGLLGGYLNWGIPAFIFGFFGAWCTQMLFRNEPGFEEASIVCLMNFYIPLNLFGMPVVAVLAFLSYVGFFLIFHLILNIAQRLLFLQPFSCTSTKIPT